MLRAIKSNFKALNRPSSLLMKYGLQLSVLLLIIAVVIYLHNDFSSNYSFMLSDISKLLASAATSVFSEIMVGSIAMDIYAKRNNIEI